MLLWSGATFGAIFLLWVLIGIRLRILTRLGTMVARDLRHKVYAHLHELSLRFFAKRRTGSLITRVTTDTDRLWDFIVFGSVSMVRDILVVVIFAAAMLTPRSFPAGRAHTPRISRTSQIGPSTLVIRRWTAMISSSRRFRVPKAQPSEHLTFPQLKGPQCSKPALNASLSALARVTG